MKNRIRIGEYIMKYRKEQGLTQGQFGELLGVSACAVSKWERELCYPDIFLLPDISRLLGASIDEMMGCKYSPCPFPRSACEKEK